MLQGRSDCLATIEIGRSPGIAERLYRACREIIIGMRLVGGERFLTLEFAVDDKIDSIAPLVGLDVFANLQLQRVRDARQYREPPAYCLAVFLRHGEEDDMADHAKHSWGNSLSL